MGSFLSSHGGSSRDMDSEENLHHGPRKRPRISSDNENEKLRLIPSLPDEISFQILARLPRICYLSVKSVSKSWKTAVTSNELFDLRKELKTTEEWLYTLTKVEDGTFIWHAFDPNSGRWQRLPPMPNFVHEEEFGGGASTSGIWTLIGSTMKIADLLKSWIQQRTTVDRSQLSGCAVSSVDGSIYVLGGLLGSAAVRCVWRFDPRLNSWCEVRSMSVGRAYCKVALLNGKLYAIGGVQKIRGGLTPLRSAEVYNPGTGTWAAVPSIPFVKANNLPAALFEDLIKPIATGMSSYRGRLYVPQSLYTWPFFIDIGGEVYDPKTDCWAEMPVGMAEGWPAKQAGTKMSVVVNGELYALDLSSSSNDAKIKVYDAKEDAWKVAIPMLPIHDFADSESPCLLAGINGKLHVIWKDAIGETSIFQVDFSRSASSSSCPGSSESSGSSTSREELWKVLTSKSFGAAELVSCEVIDV